MRVYGNLINRILEDSVSPTLIEVGMGATIHLWSDRIPATVTKVSPSGKTIEITEDRVTEWKDHYGMSFAPNPHGHVYTVRLGKRGWRALRTREGVTLGARAAYRDPSF